MKCPWNMWFQMSSVYTRYAEILKIENNSYSQCPYDYEKLFEIECLNKNDTNIKYYFNNISKKVCASKILLEKHSNLFVLLFPKRIKKTQG